MSNVADINTIADTATTGWSNEIIRQMECNKDSKTGPILRRVNMLIKPNTHCAVHFKQIVDLNECIDMIRYDEEYICTIPNGTQVMSINVSITLDSSQ